jgi:hypothetical protein
MTALPGHRGTFSARRHSLLEQPQAGVTTMRSLILWLIGIPIPIIILIWLFVR